MYFAVSYFTLCGENIAEKVVTCANDLFGQEQVCPACDQVLSEQ